MGKRKRNWTVLRDGDETLKAIRRPDDWWWVMKIYDIADCCGEKEAAEFSGSEKKTIRAELWLVPGPSRMKEEIKTKALKSWGVDLETISAEHRDNVLVEIVAEYGARIEVDHAWGGTDQSAERALMKEARWMLDDSVDALLERPVNRIGMTGLEMINGDWHSWQGRAEKAIEAAKEHEIKFGTLEIQGGKAVETNMKVVKQSKLSGECWNIQIWGQEKCAECEFRDSADCGGRNIRKTGKNEHGHKVPVA